MPQVQAQGWTGQHWLSTAGAPCSCFPIRLDRALPGRRWKCSKHWTAGCQCNTKGRIVASQEAPPRPGILRSFGTRTVHTTGPSRYTNGVIRRPEDEVESMGKMLEADRTPRRCRSQRRCKSSPDCDSATQKAHPATDGEMEGRAEGEAQGVVHPWDRPGSGHTQRNREEVHACRKPTHGAPAQRRKYPSLIAWQSTRRTFSLDT